MTETDKNRLEAEFALDDEVLLAKIAHKIKEDDANFLGGPADPLEAIYRAIEDGLTSICDSFCKLDRSPTFDEQFTLAAEILALLETAGYGGPFYSSAVVFSRIGLRRFCNCDSEAK